MSSRKYLRDRKKTLRPEVNAPKLVGVEGTWVSGREVLRDWIPPSRNDGPLLVRGDVKPIKITERVYYVQGQPGVASAANEGFNSNAGFVVTARGWW
jgi:hypothetical protein